MDGKSNGARNHSVIKEWVIISLTNPIPKISVFALTAMGALLIQPYGFLPRYEFDDVNRFPDFMGVDHTFQHNECVNDSAKVAMFDLCALHERVKAGTNVGSPHNQIIDPERPKRAVHSLQKVAIVDESACFNMKFSRVYDNTDMDVVEQDPAFGDGSYYTLYCVFKGISFEQVGIFGLILRKKSLDSYAQAVVQAFYLNGQRIWPMQCFKCE